MYLCLLIPFIYILQASIKCMLYRCIHRVIMTPLLIGPYPFKKRIHLVNSTGLVCGKLTMDIGDNLRIWFSN